MDRLYIEEPYSSPYFAEIDIASREVIARHVLPQASRYAGARVMCTDEGEVEAIVTTDGRTFLSLLSLLQPQFDKVTFFFYDGSDLDLLIGSLSEEDARSLYDSKVASANGVRIRYTPLRSITLWDTKTTVRLCSLKFWYRQYDLATACKMAGVYTDGKASEHITLELAKTIEESGRLIWKYQPSLLFSASLATRNMFFNSIRTIDLDWIPEEASEFAYNCLHAPWIDVFIRGHIPSAYDYDINSAYPFEMSGLLQLDYLGGNWFFSSSYEGDAEYGFCRALITIDSDVSVSPIRLRYGRKLCSPTGTWIGYITKDEIDFIRYYKLGEVEVLSGWWFKAKSRIRPFKKASYLFMAARTLAKSQEKKLLSYILKMAAATVYGRFLQKKQLLDGTWQAAPTFCPPYACIVMTRVKLRLAALAMQYPKNVAAVTVDGLLMTRSIPYQPSGKTGGVKLAGKGEAIVAAPLIYEIQGRESAINVGEYLKQNPKVRSIQLKDTTRTGLCVALGRDRYDLAGKVATISSTIKISQDFSRHWFHTPITAHDLLTKQFRSKAQSVEDICWEKLTDFNYIPK